MNVYLYITRHGEAEPMNANDASRQLTEHGRWEAKRTALWLKTQLGQFTQTYVSPYVRAQQTKNIILEFGPNTQSEQTTSDLIPEANAKTAVDFMLAQIDLAEHDQDIHILCVSHMPLVSYMIGELTGYTPIMATAGVAQIKIDLDKWSGNLKALLSPDQML